MRPPAPGSNPGTRVLDGRSRSRTTLPSSWRRASSTFCRTAATCSSYRSQWDFASEIRTQMAIIACKECGHQVSDKAASCPNCGAPIAVVVKPRGRAKRVIYGFLITSAAVGLIAAMLLLIRMPNRSAGTIGAFNHAAEHFPAGDSSTERSVATDQPSRETGGVLGAIYQTTAEQLYQDYGTYAVATQK